MVKLTPIHCAVNARSLQCVKMVRPTSLYCISSSQAYRPILKRLFFSSCCIFRSRSTHALPERLGFMSVTSQCSSLKQAQISRPRMTWDNGLCTWYTVNVKKLGFKVFNRPYAFPANAKYFQPCASIPLAPSNKLTSLLCALCRQLPGWTFQSCLN